MRIKVFSLSLSTIIKHKKQKMARKEKGCRRYKSYHINTLKRSSVGKNDLAIAKILDKRTGSLSLKP